MENVIILPAENLGRKFIPGEYLPEGKDEYYLRNEQICLPLTQWRHLKSEEVERLVKNGNSSDNWDEILVTDEFNPLHIKNNEFYDLQVPVGITNSIIIACDIGDDCAIHNVRYLAHVIIGNRTILVNIDELHCTNHAKFGNGIIKEGESESVRVWLDVINETGCRKIMPFDGMITADAYLWAKFRDDSALQKELKRITQDTFDTRRGYYSSIGDQCVIKNSRILKDVKIGSHCYIKGANKLKNLTIHSSAEEPTQIGEGVELVNGIIGYGSHIFYGCKAVRFIMGNNSNLKYGARLVHSFLGDNSTISCCEVLNNLIFPAHEQHHNNSFLIASVVMGQSNMAAGATIGSNHNSRANDNEVQAGRGFWPGLCTSIKHSCRFASFVLLAKGDYPAELDIPLPFSLLNNNMSQDQLEVMPAFWWMYNMYALARNTWKFQNRDKRKSKVQHIEFDSLAPDTIEEIFSAVALLEIWTAKAYHKKNNDTGKPAGKDKLVQQGKDLLKENPDRIKQLQILGENMEKSKRDVVIINTYKAYHAYHQMMIYYAIKNLMEYMENNSGEQFAQMAKKLAGVRETDWTNLGGQLMLTKDVTQLRSDIGTGKLKTWKEIHQRYDQLWADYPAQKQRHAFATWCAVIGTESPTQEQWQASLENAVAVQEYIRDQVYISRKKDYDNQFRQSTFRNHEEMIAAIGTIDENSFVQQVRDETETFKKRIKEIKKRK
jgi:NDP-sugar pyrophosphorylase family protein